MDRKMVSNSLRTTVIGSSDGKNTYEIIRELQDDAIKQGEEVIVIQLYPTIGVNDAVTIDTTTHHLYNKLKELGWSKVHMVNLFSIVSKSKLHVRELETDDEENVEYIQQLFSTMAKEVKTVISWGNSFSTNKNVAKRKKEIIDSFVKMCPRKKLYQITSDRAESETDSCNGMHILYLGLRYQNEVWKVEAYPIKEELLKLKNVLGKTNGSETKKTRGGGKRVEDNVCQDCE